MLHCTMLASTQAGSPPSLSTGTSQTVVHTDLQSVDSCMQAATQAASASKPVPKDEPEVVPMDEDVDPETKARQEAEAEAQREKEAGNAAYKQRQFEEALRHYDRALELKDKYISFLTNK